MKKELTQSKVQFDKESHTYSLNGKQLNGITSVIGTLVCPKKYDAVSDEVLAQAARRGSEVHLEVEEYVNDAVLPMFPSDEFEQFKQYDTKWYQAEYLISDNEYYASSIDIVDCDYNLYDIKTTSALDVKYVQWQLSIYAYLFKLQNGFECGKLYALWLRGNKTKLVEVDKIDEAIIKDLLNCYRYNASWSNPLEQHSIDVMQSNSEMIAQLLELEQYISEVEAKCKEAKAKQDEMKEALKTLMRENGVDKWSNDSFTITYTKPHTTTTFDKKSLEADMPELYKKYVKESQVKDSIRITKKKS